VEQAIGLTGAMVDGHRGFEKVLPDFGDLDAEVFGHVTLADGLICSAVIAGHTR